MGVRLSGFVVTGPAGSGRSTALREWVEAAERARRVRPRLVEAALDGATTEELSTWHDEADPDAVLAVDDAHLLDDAALRALATISLARPVGLSATSWPVAEVLDRLIERLIAGTDAADPAPLRRLEPVTVEVAAEWFDVETAVADSLVPKAVGNAALIDAAARHRWDGDPASVPVELSDSVLRRVRRLSDETLDVIRLAALGVDASAAVRLVGSAGEAHTERRLLAAGLAERRGDDFVIAPLVVAVVADDSTDRERARVADVALSSSSLPSSPTDLAALQLAATTSSPIDRAAASVHLGRPEAASAIAALPDLADPAAARVAFAEDVRQLRLDRAVDRRLEGELGLALGDVVLTMTGRLKPAVRDLLPADAATDVWRGLDDALASFARGERTTAVHGALRVHDDAIRSSDATLAGITPSAIAALLLLQAGEPSLAADAMGDALATGAGGPGERRTHALIRALASVQLGDYSEALDLTRNGERSDPTTDTGREALLVASLTAAIARRAGDTVRLREAWAAARPLLERSLETWLLFDQLVDLTATGVRVGDVGSARATFGRLVDQLAGLPEGGPAPVMAMWGHLQLDVAEERWDDIGELDDRWRNLESGDDRSCARVLGRIAWAEVARARAGGSPALVDLVREAADALASGGDAWDASRLLGQAALDEDDPQSARELLEAARTLVTEPVESTDRLVGAGLSEREAEVSRLVVEGHTYKEIGAQLYISPKTVEHHVARIRQRLGAGSRAELLAIVRELIGE